MQSPNTIAKNIQPFYVLISLVAAGVITIFIYPLCCIHYWRSFAILIGIAMASISVGGLLGFLFGIPRAMQTSTPPTDRRYQANTNLEQVSDWLTKIIIGLGLTQLNGIPTKLQSLSEFVGGGLPKSPSNVVFCGSFIIYFSIVGFFLVYLWSRLQLGKALNDADAFNDPKVVGQLISTLDQIEPKLDDEQRQGVAEVKKKLEDQLQNISEKTNQETKISDLAKSYERLRNTMPSSRERTKLIGGLVANAKGLAGKPGADAQKLFSTGEEGNRIIALGIIRANPKFEDLEMIVDGIANSKSGFEQYHALRAGEDLFDRLDKDSQRKIIDAIQIAKTKQKLTEKNKDRWDIADKLEKRYGGI